MWDQSPADGFFFFEWGPESGPPKTLEIKTFIGCRGPKEHRTGKGTGTQHAMIRRVNPALKQVGTAGLASQRGWNLHEPAGAGGDCLVL